MPSKNWSPGFQHFLNPVLDPALDPVLDVALDPVLNPTLDPLLDRLLESAQSVHVGATRIIRADGSRSPFARALCADRGRPLRRQTVPGRPLGGLRGPAARICPRGASPRETWDVWSARVVRQWFVNRPLLVRERFVKVR